jgi:hypothetical protein
MKYSFILLGCMIAVPLIGSDFRGLLEQEKNSKMVDPVADDMPVQENTQIPEVGGLFNERTFSNFSDFSNPKGSYLLSALADTDDLKYISMPQNPRNTAVNHNEVSSPKARRLDDQDQGVSVFDVEHHNVVNVNRKAQTRLAKKISWRCYAVGACAGASVVAGVIAFIIRETM